MTLKVCGTVGSVCVRSNVSVFLDVYGSRHPTRWLTMFWLLCLQSYFCVIWNAAIEFLTCYHLEKNLNSLFNLWIHSWVRASLLANKAQGLLGVEPLSLCEVHLLNGPPSIICCHGSPWYRRVGILTARTRQLPPWVKLISLSEGSPTVLCALRVCFDYLNISWLIYVCI